MTKRTFRTFRETKELSLEQARSFIYDPARMEARFRIFEATALPTYRMMHQKYPLSVGLLLISPSMPSAYRDRLLAFASDGAVRVVTVGEDDRTSDAVNREVALLPDDSRVYSYRYDDDDILAEHFIETILGLSDALPDGVVVSFDAGVSLLRRDQNAFVLERRSFPLIALGLGLFCRPSTPDTALGLGNHVKVEESRTVHHVERDTWIRLSHDHNDAASHSDKGDRVGLPIDEVLMQTRSLYPHIERTHFEAIPIFRKRGA